MLLAGDVRGAARRPATRGRRGHAAASPPVRSAGLHRSHGHLSPPSPRAAAAPAGLTPRRTPCPTPGHIMIVVCDARPSQPKSPPARVPPQHLLAHVAKEGHVGVLAALLDTGANVRAT